MTSIAIRWYSCEHLSQGPQNGGNDSLSREPQTIKPLYPLQQSVCIVLVISTWSEISRYKVSASLWFSGQTAIRTSFVFLSINVQNPSPFHNASSVVLPSSDLTLIYLYHVAWSTNLPPTFIFIINGYHAHLPTDIEPIYYYP